MSTLNKVKIINIVITSNYDCYILYRKGTEPNKRRLDLHIIESYAGQIIEGYGYERDNEYYNTRNVANVI